MEYDKDAYIQLIDHISNDILAGILESGSKIPSVRVLSKQYGPDTKTVYKALEVLQVRRLLIQGDQYLYVTEDLAYLEELREVVATYNISKYFETMDQIGYSRDHAKHLINKE